MKTSILSLVLLTALTIPSLVQSQAEHQHRVPQPHVRYAVYLDRSRAQAFPSLLSGSEPIGLPNGCDAGAD